MQSIALQVERLSNEVDVLKGQMTVLKGMLMQPTFGRRKRLGFDHVRCARELLTDVVTRQAAVADTGTVVDAWR
jgi:hypothetical protein